MSERDGFSSLIADLFRRDAKVALCVSVALGFLTFGVVALVKLDDIMDLLGRQVLPKWISYPIFASPFVGLGCTILGYLFIARMSKLRVGKDVPDDIQFIENKHCHVLYRISPQEYSKIAKSHLEKIGDPYRFKEQPAVFTVFAFEPCEIWRLLETEWKRTSSQAVTVEALFSVAEQQFSHFREFREFQSKYPRAIQRVLLLHGNWRDRNEKCHFDLFERLNGEIPCYVLTRGTLTDVTFLTDYAVIGKGILDYNADAESLVITYLDTLQNPQVMGYLMGLRNRCNQTPRPQLLAEFRSTNNV